MDKSYLFTPTLKADSLAVNDYSQCCVAVLDLEDSIHPGMKARARRELSELDFAKLGHYKKLSLRLNTIETVEGIKDIHMLSRRFSQETCPLDSVFISKVRHPREIEVYRALFDEFAPDVKMIPIIETIEALEHIDEIARISEALILGQADLIAGMYAHNQTFVAQARAKICIYAAKYNIIAIDTNSFELNNMETFEQQCLAAQQEGFLAKAAIHPCQLDIINRVFDIPDTQKQEYQAIYKTYSHSVNGFAIRDGRVIAPPFAAHAKKMLDTFERNE